MKNLKIFELPVHPAADVFPMLDDDELAELANDISENGLQQPVVVAKVGEEWMLIDGRNRRAACKLVRVEPAYTVLDRVADISEHILSLNIYRRHMTKGQRAMAVARVYPEAKRGRGNIDPAKGEVSAHLSYRRVQEARTVLKYAPDQADLVLSGAVSLDDAYCKAQESKNAANSVEQRFARLKSEWPDLATQVEEGRLALDEAIAAGSQREARIRAQRIAVSKNISNFSLFASNTSTQKHVEEAVSVFRNAPDLFKEASGMTVEEYLSALVAVRDRADIIIKRLSE